MSRFAGAAARRRGPSGRPHEPSGNRRPQMDDRRRALGRGTEPGVQAASLAPSPCRSPVRSVSPRRPGRCAIPCRHCRWVSPPRGLRAGAGLPGQGRGSPRRRRDRWPGQRRSVDGRCSGGSAQQPAGAPASRDLPREAARGRDRRFAAGRSSAGVVLGSLDDLARRRSVHPAAGRPQVSSRTTTLVAVRRVGTATGGGGQPDRRPECPTWWRNRR